MDILDQIKKIRESIQNMSDAELLQSIREIDPESAEKFAALERWILES